MPKVFAIMSNSYIFALFLDKVPGCSAVRLAHLLWEQGVAGSNPATPTNKKHLQIYSCKCFLFEVFNVSELFHTFDDYFHLLIPLR